jgi:hypothetical protein
MKASTRGPAVLILDQESVGPRIAEARKLRGLLLGRAA